MSFGLPPGIRDWPGLQAQALALALDYDGTLVPIRQRPEDAHPDSNLLDLLQALARVATVIVLTGRPQGDMGRWLLDPAITIVSSHGARWRHKGDWHPLLLADDNRDFLKSLAQRLRDRFRGDPGVIIEDKGATVAFHYRLVNPQEERQILDHFERVVTKWREENPGFEILEGKCVKEIRPEGLDKGRALRRVMERLGNRGVPVLVMGDDQTDEDMFRSLDDHDVSVLVGTKDTSAAVRLRDVWEARKVLEEILAIRQKTGDRRQKSK